MEADRRGKVWDDGLTDRSALEVELADIMIRTMALAGHLGFDLEGAITDKVAYNSRRPDHDPETRKK